MLYDLYVQAASNTRPLERFGLDVFRKGEANPAYLPMDLPVGANYVVGPGDSLSFDLWGGVAQRLLRTVDREGRVSLPEVGPILVSGRSLGDVQQEVQRVLRTQFRDVSADVSLQRLRTVRVYVVGDVASPGAYDVSSLSTPINALFAAGGVTEQGSLRRLEHYRGKQLIEEVDAYDLLLHGIRGDLARLENGDSLLVPPLGAVVKVDGMVRRPALYELHSETTLEDALDLAGGILPAAALRHIEVQRLVAHEKRTMLSVEIGETSDPEAVRAQLRGLRVQDGDEIHIFPIAPYNSASIYLEGHVLRPGRYSYKPEMKLTDLVTSYADLLPEPSTRYAEIIRLSAPDYRPVVETFDLATALEHPDKAPKLEPLDTVQIFGRYDFEPDPEVL
ncbi:MAG: sugar transporter, partial [Acidobacteria bacterium]